MPFQYVYKKDTTINITYHQYQASVKPNRFTVIINMYVTFFARRKYS